MLKKIVSYIIHPSKILIFLVSKNIVKMDDRKYLKIRYKSILGKKLNIENPKTFNEKLQWLKIYDRKDIYTKMADKNLAKIFVKDKIGEEYIIPTIGVYNNYDEIDFSLLPESFVMKCTHDSGGVLVVSDKSKFIPERYEKCFKKALSKNFFYEAREWPYKNIEPKIIVEKYMGNDLTDYRFYCFNGKVKMIYQYLNQSQYDGSKPEPTYCNIYDEDWNILPFRQAYAPSKKKYDKPIECDKMIELSEILSSNTKFLRVDFYIIDGKVYFGELTFYPGGGMSRFYPDEADLEVGKLLNLGDKNEK